MITPPAASSNGPSAADAHAVDGDAVAARIEAALRAAGTPDRAAKERAYLKSDLAFVGASVPSIRRTTRTVRRELSELDHDALVAVVHALWRRHIHECRMAAVELLELEVAQLTPADLAWLERLLREAGTWALVDGLAASVVGVMLEHHPAVDEALDRWATDADFWLRRTALLALLPGVRRGVPDRERITRYADAMLEEREFFVRKAIGWVLREAGKHDAEFVAGWLAPRASRASGVTVREAVKYLPDDERERLLKAYRSGQPR